MLGSSDAWWCQGVSVAKRSGAEIWWWLAMVATRSGGGEAWL